MLIGPEGSANFGPSVLLRQHRTKPGIVDGDFWNIRVRRL